MILLGSVFSVVWWNLGTLRHSVILSLPESCSGVVLSLCENAVSHILPTLK